MAPAEANRTGWAGGTAADSCSAAFVSLQPIWQPPSSEWASEGQQQQPGSAWQASAAFATGAAARLMPMRQAMTSLI